MYCRECGNVMGEADKFCPACGSKTPPAQTQTAPAASSPPPLSTQPTQSAGSSMDFSMAGIKGNLEKLGEDKNIFLIGAAALVLSMILSLMPFFSISLYGVTRQYSILDLGEDGTIWFFVLIACAISLVCYLLPLVKGTYLSKYYLPAKIVTIVMLAFLLLEWLGNVENARNGAEISLTFTGWLTLAMIAAAVILSFLVPSKLRKKGFL